MFSVYLCAKVFAFSIQMTAKIRMPAQVDPNIVKIAVELENHQAQLIEFDQKVSLTSELLYPCLN